MLPVEATPCPAEENVDGFDKAETSENLTRIDEIDGYRSFAHQTVSFSPGANRSRWAIDSGAADSVAPVRLCPASSSNRLEARWSAARNSASHQARPHGPHRHCNRAKRVAISCASRAAAVGGRASQPSIPMAGRALP